MASFFSPSLLLILIPLSVCYLHLFFLAPLSFTPTMNSPPPSPLFLLSLSRVPFSAYFYLYVLPNLVFLGLPHHFVPSSVHLRVPSPFMRMCSSSSLHLCLPVYLTFCLLVLVFVHLSLLVPLPPFPSPLLLLPLPFSSSVDHAREIEQYRR